MGFFCFFHIVDFIMLLMSVVVNVFVDVVVILIVVNVIVVNVVVVNVVVVMEIQVVVKVQVVPSTSINKIC